MSTETPTRRFKAFISYSHAADGRLAPALQQALQAFTKPWYALRACRVFRDETTLSVTSELWPTIERALLDSEYFVLLASPDSADSKWVAREVERWCEERPARNILILLTEGAIAWNANARDFEWTDTTALPRCLSGEFEQEPLYLDLRWARTVEHVSTRHPQFLEAVADISCSLRGLSKDELLGRDVREHRRTRRIIKAVVAVLLALTTAAVVASVQATRALRLAEERRVQARGVAETIVFELQESLQGIPEATDARRVLSDKAKGLLTALGTEESDFRLKRALMVQHSHRAEEATAQGKLEVAREELLLTLGLAKEVAGQDAMSSAFRRDVSVSLNKLGDISTMLGDHGAAQQYLEQDLAISRELLARDPASLAARQDLAISLEKLGKLCLSRGDAACARRFLTEDVSLMRELHAAYPTNRGVERGLGIALIELGEMMFRERDLDHARESFREVLLLMQQLDRDTPWDARIKRHMSVAFLKLGDIALLGKDVPDAQAEFERALQLRRSLLARNPEDAGAQRDLAFVLGRMGSTRISSKNYHAGVLYMEEALPIQSSLVKRDSSDVEMRRDLGINLYELAKALIELNRFPDAQERLARSIEILRGLPAGSPKSGSGDDLTLSLRRSGLVELHLRNGPLAANLHREACARIKDIPDGALDAGAEVSWVFDLGDMAAAHRDSPVGDRGVARQCATEALRRLESVRGRDKKAQDDAELTRMLAELRRFLETAATGARVDL